MKFKQHYFLVQSLSPVQLFVNPWTAHAKPPCPSPSPRVCSNSCPLSPWCHPTISSSVAPFSSLSSVFPSLRVFSSELVLCIREPKYWSFSLSPSPSNEYLRLISFRTDWLLCCSPRDSQESSLAPQFESINSLVLSLLYGPTLTSVHDYWENHSFDHMNLCWQSDSAF